MDGADHGAAKDCELADLRHALEFEIRGEGGMAADVGEDRERAGGDDRAADGEAVETVGEIDGIARDHDDDKTTKKTNGRKARGQS